MRARIGKNEKAARLAVRVPEPLHEYLAEYARQSNRSINYEVLLRLEATQELDRIFLRESQEEKLEALEQLKQRMIGLRLTTGDK